MLSGIIEDHFPMHKRNQVKQIQESFKHYRSRLLSSFRASGPAFQKHFQPINMIKNYYGEKYAFEYAYLMHYQSWLFVPSFLGLLLFFYQVSRYLETGDFKLALDSEMNAPFGLFVSIWATLFVESWKKK